METIYIQPEDIADATIITLLTKLEYPLNYLYDPAWFQIKKWLWTKHTISIEIECVSITTKMFKVRVYQFVDGEPGLITYLHFNNPIDAEIEGIKAAIKYLWEKK